MALKNVIVIFMLSYRLSHQNIVVPQNLFHKSTSQTTQCELAAVLDLNPAFNLQSCNTWVVQNLNFPVLGPVSQKFR